MSLRTKNNPMGAGSKYYTLTVSLNPASATCILTYDGVSYTTTSVKVKAETVVSYSISHETYGTYTGEVIVDKDTTLTCVGTYTTDPVDVSWTQPKLSANGTMGGSSFACHANSEYSSSYAAWHAFDGVKSSSNAWIINNPPSNKYITAYSPTPIKVSKINVYNRNAYSVKAGAIYGSNDNSTWTTLKSFSNSTTASGKTWTITVNATDYYKYIKLNMTSGVYAKKAHTCIGELTIIATYQSSSYTHYWDVTES